MTPLQRRTFDLVLVALADVSFFMVAFDIVGPLRWIPVCVTVLLLPGAVIVPRLDLDDAPTFFGVAVVTSIAVSTVMVAVMVWANWWHPLGLAAGLALVCSAALVKDVIAITRHVNHAADALPGQAWS